MDLSNLDLSSVEWRKSMRSQATSNNCVEVAELPGGNRAVRDSKKPGGPVLGFTSTGWNSFIGCIKSGELGW
ncbi:hypothetical protein Ssi03_67650 [Sphaerisporangium siamense]|uniref:DUF397 domain-containing protein n=1 Tax=Sphaerisporangium siamense TaxID=795645 RepID=A0A7W7D5Y2_9ACTN|nr:DUF397 domain-containing protein [Sphaerisporangium siamense]MBB4700726.1 hypothetical protein [Sphaerisporangium siamense]GII88775.1 hypothetical protein Ssi03_67650 [Sphaerisporangium siamense]